MHRRLAESGTPHAVRLFARHRRRRSSIRRTSAGCGRSIFSSDDQLLTLAMGGGPDPETWALARQVGAPIVNHIVGNTAGNRDDGQGRADEARTTNTSTARS